MIIGIVSHYAGGKDTVSEYLKKEKEFIYYSLSDIIRDELKKRGMSENRDNLINVGNDLRKKFGNKILAKRSFDKIKKTNKNVVLGSIRNPSEVKFLKKQKNFFLVKIDCPIEIRYERLKERNRIGDIKSLEEFIKKEKQEESSDPSKQQIHKVVQMADLSIDNSGSLNQLYKNINKLIKKLRGESEC